MLPEPQKAVLSFLEGLPGGAARGTRTPDPVITNDVLYQLSYCGETKNRYPHLISASALLCKNINA